MMDERNPAQRPELLLCQRGDERAAPAQRKEGSGLWLDREPTWHRADRQLSRQAQRCENGHGQLAGKAGLPRPDHGRPALRFVPEVFPDRAAHLPALL